MKTGGIWQALKICSLAEMYGVECMIGCMLESQLAVAAAAHLAAGQAIITRADLDGPSLCAVDPYYRRPQLRRGHHHHVGRPRHRRLLHPLLLLELIRLPPIQKRRAAFAGGERRRNTCVQWGTNPFISKGKKEIP